MARDLQAVQNLLRQGKRSVRRSATWESIRDATGCGTVRGNQIEFTLAETERLRDYIIRQHGLDPLKDDTSGSRLRLAGMTSNEKLAQESVFGSLLQFAAPPGQSVPLKAGPYVTPSGTVLGVDESALDMEELLKRRLVIIENGALMVNWDRYRLPAPWDQALRLYRGHGDNLRRVAGIIDRMAGSAIAYFFDFDPAGIAMAIHLGKGNLVVPAGWESLTQDYPFNKRTEFFRQQDALRRVRSRARGEIARIAAHLDTQQLAVTQEHLVSIEGAPFTALPLTLSS